MWNDSPTLFQKAGDLMSEREFELYLSVLSRMLRLNEQQRDAISDELRDHMEERFEELVRSGMNRDDAIRQALDEFGDAAGLAVDFTNVSRKRIRRIVMRSTAAIASIAAVCAFFLTDVDPQQPGLPGPGQLVAQNSDTPADAQPDDAASDSKPDVAEPVAIERKPIDFVVAGEVVAPAFLQEPTTANFLNFPLEEVVDWFSAFHNVSILLDKAGLEEDGLTTDMPITLKLDQFPAAEKNDSPDEADGQADRRVVRGSQVTLQQALDWITRSSGTEWYVEEGIIHVTSAVAEAEREISRSYFIRQFLIDGFTENSLIDTIQKMTSGQWMNIDGDGGTLALVGDVLTIRQNWQTHREIELLLGTLLHHEKESPVRYPTESLRLARQIEQRVEEIDFVEVPLSDVVAFLSDVSEIGIRVDEEALSEEGWDMDALVSLEVQNQSLRTILRLGLKPIGLQAIVHEGSLEITTASRAKETLSTVAYDVRDLDDKAGQLRQLEAAIESTNGGPWLDRDGDGGVLLIPGGGRMLVRQTDEGHREIRQLLAAQRRAASLGKTFDSTGADLTRTTEVIRSARRAPLEKRFYRVPSETADDLLPVLPASIEPGTWIQAAMFGQGTNLERSVGTIAKVQVGQKVVKISNPTGDGAGRKNSKAAKGGNAGTASASPSTDVLVVPEAVLIIDQTPAVHDKIEKFLQKLDMDVKGVSLEDAKTNGRGGGGLGGGGFF
jgi:Arc/MetJ-type ribon-helix-helix transcriptional regulator